MGKGPWGFRHTTCTLPRAISTGKMVLHEAAGVEVIGPQKAHGPTRNATAPKNLVFLNISDESEHSVREIYYPGKLSGTEQL